MSDWYLSQLARQDQYGDTPPANWPVMDRDPFEAAALRTRQSVRPEGGRDEAPGQILGPVVHALGEPIRKGQGWLQSGLNYSANEFPATQGATQQSTDYDPRREAAGYAAGTAFNTLGMALPFAKPGVVGSAGGKLTQPEVMGELASPFYSAAGRAVENAKLGKGTSEQWLGYLRNQPGVKPEELNYVFGNLPEGQLTKAQMQAHAAENAVRLGEVKKFDKDTINKMSLEEIAAYNKNHSSPPSTKYSQWQLPGGENYRETLLTLPKPEPKSFEQFLKDEGYSAKQIADPESMAKARRGYENVVAHGGALPNVFRSSHWDESNVLAHVRTNDREIPGVGKSLHVEEIQSDWHQKGRTGGYEPTQAEREVAAAQIKEIRQKQQALLDERGNPTGDNRAEWIRLDDAAAELGRTASNMGGRVPDAPFKSTWADVALKRQIREASEKGYDAISWTPGEAQAARYDLSKHVDNVKWEPAFGSTNQLVKINPKGGSPIEFYVNNKGVVEPNKGYDRHAAEYSGKNLSDIIGKEVAEKIVGSHKGELSGEGLKIGGEGMRAFYDKMLVDKTNAIGKKHGARVEQSHIEKELTVPEARRQGVPITTDKALVGKQPVHVLRITPELRAAAMKGFPLFTAGGVVAGGTISELARQDKYGRNE